jgi:RNA polymerase sigma factor (sigma-70 family)
MTGTQAGLVLRHLRRVAGARGYSQSADGQLLERFAVRRDEAAFEALVRRHGPMVLNVCRGVLHHEQDAEDAFQATFLVLARRAASIRRPEAVAGWLYEVAHHVAIKAQTGAARRRDRERRATPLAPADPTLDMTLRDLRRVLHEELRRLPDKYRVPLVLCYLEGRSQEEAAAQLGWSKGTFRGRLDRGREYLRRRLAARGVALSALLCAAAVAPRAAAEALVNSVVRAGAHSAQASVLAEGVIRAMWTSKLKLATAVLLAVGLIAGAGALARQALAAKEPPETSQPPAASTPKPEPAAAKEAAKPPAEDKATITYAGRVLAPDGKPVAGAKLYLTLAWGYPHEPEPSPEFGTTGPDGRFRFTVPLGKFGDHLAVVAAAAAGYGAGWVEVRPDGKLEDLTLRLAEDDVPITGQIVDLEGKPIAGVTLRVMQINAAPREDLGPWLKAVKAGKDLNLQLEQQYLNHFTIALPFQTTTDAAGRFRLTGVGRNRLVRTQLDGPTVVSQHLQMLTRPGKAFDVTEYEGQPEYGVPRKVATYYGADFRHVAAPCKPIVGVVRDADTHKPLAGVTVRSMSLTVRPGMRSQFDLVRATTDAEGRYRLTGMPKRAGNFIAAVPGHDQPYVAANREVPESPGLDPVTVDMELRRGVWIEGKLTDKATGKPLRGSVEYFSLYSNPHLRDYPGFDGTMLMGELTVGAKEDGSFRIVGLPGPGLIGVYYQKPTEPYLRANARDDEFGTKDGSLETSPYHISFTSNFNAMARIDPAKGAESVKRDITLDAGWTFTGAVVGPDGKPLAGVLGYGVAGPDLLKTAEFTVQGFNPSRPRDIFFRHLEKGLVGVAQPPKKNGGSVTVRMEPGATITGRLVDADGKPRAGVGLEVFFRTKEQASAWPWHRYLDEPAKTDGEGRFRFAALLPGRDLRLSDGKGDLELGGAPRSGETKDLGDVRMKEQE